MANTMFTGPSIKFFRGKNIENNTDIEPGAFYLDTESNELWYDDPDVSVADGKHIRLFDAHFNNIYNQLADLQYEQIAIKDFSLKDQSSLVEYGDIIEGSLVFNWAANKPPIYLTVTELSSGEVTENIFQNNTTVSSGTTTIYPLTNITDTRSYRLTLGDARTRDDANYPDLADATKDVKITFCYPVFYGAVTQGTSFDTSIFSSLTKKLQTNRKGSFTVNTGSISDNKISIFAIPESYGTPTFSVGGFATTFPSTTAYYDYEDKHTLYNIYYGTNVGLGSHTIVVT